MPNAAESYFTQQLQDEQPLVVRRLQMSCGQNSQDQADAIREDELATLQNANTSSAGVRATRAGATQIADAPVEAKILGLDKFYVEGSTKFLSMVVGTEWYTWNGVDAGFSAVSDVALTDGLLANLVTAGKRQFLLNGTDNVFSTNDGAAGTDEGNTNTSVPHSRFGIYHQNMLLVAGNSTNRSYIWPSNVLAPQTFDRSGRAIKVADQDNDELTALVNLSLSDTPGFMAFKNRSVYFVDTSTGGSDPSTWIITPVDNTHGAVGSRAAASIGSSLLVGDCIFLSKEGTTYRLRSLRRTVADKFGTGGILSNAIADVLSDCNHAKMHEAQVFYHNQRIFLTFPSASSTTNDVLAVLDLRNSKPNEGVWKWSIWTGWAAACFATYEEASAEYLYYGDTASGKVFRALSGTSDDGTAIAYQEASRREDFGFPELDKIFQFVEVVLLSTDITTVYVDAQLDGNGYTSLGSMKAAPENVPTLPVDLPFNLIPSNKIRKVFQLDGLGLGRDVQIRIRHEDLDKTVNVLGYTIVAFIEPLHLETRS